ncbi:MAG: nucleotidyltransferase domain-containing protein [Candidatus Omnitrophica bacterium]|nr:nucleotidyltransferase domain-containing protein [Candidatus Omnitrophota bacterium]
MKENFLTDEIEALVKKANNDKCILSVVLYGSRSRGITDGYSDIDICLVLRKGRYDPLSLSRKKMQYLCEFDMDIQIFQQLPLYIRRRVIKDGRILFSADDDELYDMVFRTIDEFEDYKSIYFEYLKEVEHAR